MWIRIYIYILWDERRLFMKWARTGMEFGGGVRVTG